MKKIYNKLISVFLCMVLIAGLVPRIERTVSAYTYPNGYVGGMAGSGSIVAHGLDVSAWQESGLNFQNFANAGYKFVILRCGTSKGKDKCFEEYYNSAKAAGLDVGCYFYSYALNEATAKQEAQNVLSWIKGKVFEYPVYFDFEDPTQIDLSYDLSAKICRGFMDVVKNNGYLVGLYSMSWILNRSWIDSSGIRDTYEGWVAHVYSDANNTGITSGEYNIYKDRYCRVYGMHQYSFTTYVNGAGAFDANVSYKDYPGIVKRFGFNGYDDKGPTVTDIVYTNVSASGYTISCRATDSAGVSKVAFPTWTMANGQDDLVPNWDTRQLGTKNGDVYTFRVNISDHNNERGMYATHIYAFDNSGHQTHIPLDPVDVRNDTGNPVISDVVFSDVSAAGYTITCKVMDDWGISNVCFPTWTTNNGQDDLIANWPVTQRGTQNGHYYTFRVNASDHRNETGMYETHIYATDCAGHEINLPLAPVEVRNDTQKPVISNASISNISAQGYTVTCKVTDDWGINAVAFPTWTTYNGQDDLAAMFMETQQGTRSGDIFTFHVKVSDHNNEQGFYVTHIYARDCAGNVSSFELGEVNVQNVAQKIALQRTSGCALENGYVTEVSAGMTLASFLKEFENETLEAVSTSGRVLAATANVGTGVIIRLKLNGKIVDQVTVVVTGDVDGSGVVDSTDYMRIRSSFLKTFNLNAVQTMAADVDNSGTVDNTDYLRIKSDFLGLYDL